MLDPAHCNRMVAVERVLLRDPAFRCTSRKGGPSMRRALIALLICPFIASPSSQADAARNISYQKRWVHDVSAHVVTANLNAKSVRVTPALARHGIGTSEGFGSMVSRLQPTAAITGTYFCVNKLIPVADLVIEGHPISLGSVGTAICFTADNKVEFKRTRIGRSEDWSGYVSVISGGPRLVSAGVAYVSPSSEGFRDGGMYRAAARAAVGMTKNNKLLLVTVNSPVYLSKMARLMRDLGAVDAINLDGGSSTALYYRGLVPSHPGRRLTNLLLLYETNEAYARAKDLLNPRPMFAVGSPCS